MSKSYGNAIPLDSTKREVEEKIRTAVTDPARIRKTDPGHPEICPIFTYHNVFRPEGSDEIGIACRLGHIGCTECK